MTWPDQLSVIVTAKDIDLGRARDCKACPVALAASRAAGARASVYGGYIRFTLEDEKGRIADGAIYGLPFHIGAAIRRYDMNYDNETLAGPPGQMRPMAFIAPRIA